MTYHVELSPDGSLPLPDELAAKLGLAPGDTVTIDLSGSGIVVRRDDGRDLAIARLRSALQGYSVDQFLAERRSNWDFAGRARRPCSR